MRVCIKLEATESLRIPINYNHAVQGLIYNLLNEDLRSFLHERGFQLGKRRFKLFTFSRLLGSFKMNGFEVTFRGPIRLYISSPTDKFVEEIVHSLIKKDRVLLYDKELSVKEIYIPEKPNFEKCMVFRTFSPITIYSTLVKADGIKKTYYYSPYEREFNELLLKNLIKKATLLGRKTSKGFRIEPLHRKSCREIIVNYKNTIVRAWEGFFKVEGDPKLLEVMYETGLGNKNSAGFGMMEVASNV